MDKYSKQSNLEKAIEQMVGNLSGRSLESFDEVANKLCCEMAELEENGFTVVPNGPMIFPEQVILSMEAYDAQKLDTSVGNVLCKYEEYNDRWYPVLLWNGMTNGPMPPERIQEVLYGK